MQKIETKSAPQAIGPYSQGVIANTSKLAFFSGQVALNPVTGKLVEGGIEEQTSQVFDNLEALLEEAGLTLANIVRMEVFMIDMEEFAAMNRIYAKRFEGIEHPARFAVEVSRLPANARVEIAAIAAFE